MRWDDGCPGSLLPRIQLDRLVAVASGGGPVFVSESQFPDDDKCLNVSALCDRARPVDAAPDRTRLPNEGLTSSVGDGSKSGALLRARAEWADKVRETEALFRKHRREHPSQPDPLRSGLPHRLHQPGAGRDVRGLQRAGAVGDCGPPRTRDLAGDEVWSPSGNTPSAPSRRASVKTYEFLETGKGRRR